MEHHRSAELIAVEVTPGDSFVNALQRCWNTGAAVAPLPSGVPAAWRRLLLDRIRPTAVLDPDGRLTPFPGGRPAREGDALVLTTSGTMGNPKVVVHTHAGVAAAANITSRACGVGPDSRWLACIPLHHAGGLGVVTRAVLCGTPLEVHDGFDPTAVAAAAARNGATHTSLVVTALGRIDPSPFTCILLGGSAIPDVRPPNTIATYGSTETYGGVIYDGRCLDGVEVRIRPTTGDPDADGPIEIRSPTLLRCYRQGDADVAACDPGGWYPMGDLGRIDPGSGLVHVSGRADEVIVTGGEKVWPGAVERLLEAHPGVAEVAVVGRSDPEWGQRVTAVVVPRPGHPPPTLAALGDLVRDRLPSYAVPRALELVDGLPYTSLGKLRRSAL